MKDNRLILLLLTALGCWGCANTQPMKDTVSFVSVYNTFDTLAAVSAANEILADLKNFVSEKDVKELGFDSFDDLQLAVHGSPIRVFTVMYSAVAYFCDYFDTKDCVVNDEYVHFPISVRGVVTTSLELFKDVDQRWKFARFGNPVRARLIKALSDSLSHQSWIPRNVSFFYLQIPSKYISFVGYYDEAKLRMYLFPLADRQKNKLVKGMIYDAKSIFESLR